MRNICLNLVGPSRKSHVIDTQRDISEDSAAPKRKREDHYCLQTREIPKNTDSESRQTVYSA